VPGYVLDDQDLIHSKDSIFSFATISRLTLGPIGVCLSGNSVVRLCTYFSLPYSAEIKNVQRFTSFSPV
jgi:hypothetical protein